jgi:hypothetical protein
LPKGALITTVYLRISSKLFPGESKMKELFCIIIAAMVMPIGTFAFAQSGDYPTRPITLQVPWVAGGGEETGKR